MGLAVLIMLIAFGDDLSSGAAGCFQKISEPQPTESVEHPTPPAADEPPATPKVRVRVIRRDAGHETRDTPPTRDAGREARDAATPRDAGPRQPDGQATRDDAATKSR